MEYLVNSGAFPQKGLKLFFGISAFEGVICLVLLLFIQTDTTDAWLLGYSRSRVLMLFVFLMGIILFSGTFVLSWKKRDGTERLAIRIDSFLQSDKSSTIVLGLFSIGFVLSIIYLGFAYTNLDYRVLKDAITSMEQVKAYMVRLAPFFIWIAMICGQGAVLLTIYGYGTKSRFLRVLKVIAILIFPIYSVIFWVFNRIDPYYYNRLTKEDNIVEWLTVVFLLLAAVFSILQAAMSRRGVYRFVWFFILFAIACCFFAVEEISWGQRLFGVDSPEYFMTYSDQQEINVHNVVNKTFSVRTKHIAAWALLGYGVALPILARSRWVHSKLNKLGIVIPPEVLIPGFILASTMTWDRYFTGQDEEVAEFFFSILIFLVMVFQFWVTQPHANFGEKDAVN